MRWAPRSCRYLVLCLGVFTWSATALAAPPDPLRLVPDQADLLLEVKHPARIAELAAGMDLLRQVQVLAPVKERLDSTNVRRLLQLVAYFEKELGAKWPVLLERVAGGGAVVAVKLGPDPQPALFVIQGTDEESMHQFTKLALNVLEQELARQESKEKIEKAPYRQVETVRLGKELRAAVVGSALLVSNQEKALQLAIDLHLDGDQKSMARIAGVAEARKLLPPEPLAAAWLNMEKVRQGPEVKDAYRRPRDNFLLTVVAAGIMDILGRAPFLCAGLYAEKNELRLTLRAPAGWEGATSDLAVHAAPPGQPASRPLLQPKGVLYSACNYVDLGRYWEDRTKLFTAKQVADFENFDKSSSTFLAGNHFSKLLTMAGPYQRFVAVNQPDKGYKITPKTLLPAFALVVEMREPEELRKAMETVLRGVALLATTQVGLKMVEEKRGEHAIVGYRFREDRALPQDVNDLRFNFSPCFFSVGKQFAACSTLELAHEMVDLLEAEEKGANAKGASATGRAQVHGAAVAELLHGLEDFFLTQAILDQALSPDEARQQVRQLIDMVRHLGTVEQETYFGDRESHYDIRWIMNK